VRSVRTARPSGGEAACGRKLREAHRLFTEIGAAIRVAEVAKELREVSVL